MIPPNGSGWRTFSSNLVLSLCLYPADALGENCILVHVQLPHRNLWTKPHVASLNTSPLSPLHKAAADAGFCNLSPWICPQPLLHLTLCMSTPNRLPKVQKSPAWPTLWGSNLQCIPNALLSPSTLSPASPWPSSHLTWHC